MTDVIDVKQGDPAPDDSDDESMPGLEGDEAIPDLDGDGASAEVRGRPGANIKEEDAPASEEEDAPASEEEDAPASEEQIEVCRRWLTTLPHPSQPDPTPKPFDPLQFSQEVREEACRRFMNVLFVYGNESLEVGRTFFSSTPTQKPVSFRSWSCSCDRNPHCDPVHVGPQFGCEPRFRSGLSTDHSVLQLHYIA